ncbi:uncharacterized protein PG998_002405 [Apiospora kogelbergensis]|uniref:uncharacterized protein n=1 Tax=Apiospora kogelbergensis TaxID=1337665 RepID=UPI0031306C41
MGLRDMLKKKDRLSEGYSADGTDAVNRLAAPEFTFIRSDTHTEERIFPPAPEEEYQTAKDSSALTAAPAAKPRRSLDVFKSRSRGSSTSSVGNANEGAAAATAAAAATTAASPSPPLPQQQQQQQNQRSSSENQLRPKETMGRRLSQRLHIGTSSSSRRTSATTSEFVPENLPTINLPPDAAEPEWEARATILAHQTEQARSRSGSVTPSPLAEKENPFQLPPLNYGRDSRDAGFGAAATAAAGNAPRPTTERKVSSQQIDADIQEAIRLHEDGQLEQSTVKFGILADPNGANNPLSQVLYGLALRHGWGCTPDPARAITFLSAAASNAALVEDLALKAGMKKGGAAKGELVLAIFELANCFRHGWGIPKDSVAAKQYYETAANLGDTDAMNEVAWCYVEGFGCKKDKYSAAKYYRLAEKNGNKTLGNTWIWKDKYNPPDANGNGGKHSKKK